MGELDIAFVIDETGSMGSYLNSVKENVTKIVKTISQLSGVKSLRYALIGYHDHTDPKVVEVHVPLTDKLDDMLRGVNKLQASGGGDYPEAVTDGLYELVRLDWRPNAVKTAVLIADAPPHGVGAKGDSYPKGCPCNEKWEVQVETCREVGIVIHTVSCQGMTTNAWKKIAEDTWGQALNLANATKLPSILTGVAEVDLQKLVIRDLVAEKIKSEFNKLQSVSDEQERVQSLLSELQKDSAKVNSLNSSFEVTQRNITLADIEQALYSLRRNKLLNTDLFPSIGLLPPQEKSGLFNKDSKEMIPLTGVSVTANILDTCCEVEIVQSYINSYDHPIEAVYQFPVDDTAAVCGFIAELEHTKIIAKCMDKDKAADTYSDAIASGKGAYLLEQKKGDLFSMSVGNMAPGKTVKIRITYVTQLQAEEAGLFRFFIPTTVAPRYTPLASKNSDDYEENKDGPYTSDTTYKMELKINIESSSPFKQISSPSHKINTTQNSDRAAVVTLAEQETALNGDFLLLIQTELKSSEPTVVIEEWIPEESATEAKESSSYAAMITFQPQFNAELKITQDVLLLIDCSVSMCGDPLEAAKKAASFVLTSLAKYSKCSFNVVAWGNGFKSLHTSLFSVNASNIQSAQNFVSNLQANMGGTEILKVLKSLNKEQGPISIILFTDGGFADSEDISSFLVKNSKLTVFPVGVGSAPNHPNLRKIARLSKGSCEICLPGEDIEKKMNRLIQQSLSAVKLDWGTWSNDDVLKTPSSLPPIRSNSLHTVYCILPQGVLDLSGKISLTGTYNYGKQTFKSSVKLNTAQRKLGRMIHRLAASSIIRDLQDAQPNDKDTIIKLATRFTLASKYTSFVAVEERSEAIEQSAELVKVPLQQAKNTASSSVAPPSPRGAPPPPASLPSPAAAPPPPSSSSARPSGGWVFLECYDPTIEDSYRKQVIVDDQVFLLDITDGPGDESFRAFQDLYIKHAHCIICVFGLNNHDTFTELENIIDNVCRIKDKDISEIPLIIVGNKVDLEDRINVSEEEARKLAEKYNKTYIMTSAKTGVNGGKAFYEVIRDYISMGYKDSSGYNELKIALVGCGGVGKTCLSVGFSHGGYGYDDESKIFYRDKSKDKRPATTKQSEGLGTKILKFLSSKNNTSKFKPLFGTITSKYKIDRERISHIQFAKLFEERVVKYEEGAHWELNDLFFTALSTPGKKCVSHDKPNALPTAIVLCVFEILLKKHKDVAKKLPKLEQYKATAENAYRYLLKEFDASEGTAELNDFVSNTCVLLKNEFGLLV